MLATDRAGPPSVFNQGDVAAVRGLVDSPRNYNCSIVDFGGRRLMAYRSHRMDRGGRCGIVLAELDGGTATANHWIELPMPTSLEHHEDPRLFIFKGALHLCYVESRLYRDRPYSCAIQYCRLEQTPRKGWKAIDVCRPRYGRNDGMHQEKNWQFFEDAGKLRCIYEAEPHTILEIEGERVVAVGQHKSATAWPWGTIRGGCPPLRLTDGRWLTFFHSATFYPQPPHWRRYYAGAYVFEPGPNWRIVAMSREPILTGSAEDGHAYDPRQIDSWKPFVVFPCGAVADGKGWLVSYGINDHFSALVRHTDLKLGKPDFSDWAPRYFRTDNASLPLHVATDDRNTTWMNWQAVGPTIGGARTGIMKAGNPRLAMMLEELAPSVEEIDEASYRGMGGK